MRFVLLHGLGADRSQPLDLVRPVLPEDADVLALDIRAHGASPLVGGPADFSFESVTAELEHEVRLAGFATGPITVIGISLGAALALRLAETSTLDIVRLVALRPAFTAEPLPGNLAVFPVIGELLHRLPADRAEAEFRGSGAYRAIQAVSPLGAAGVMAQFRATDARGRAIRLVEFPRNTAFAAGAERAGMPVSIIAAPRDPLHPLAVAELWHRLLPASTLTVVPARDDGMRPYVAAMRGAVSAVVR